MRYSLSALSWPGAAARLPVLLRGWVEARCHPSGLVDLIVVVHFLRIIGELGIRTAVGAGLEQHIEAPHELDLLRPRRDTLAPPAADVGGGVSNLDLLVWRGRQRLRSTGGRGDAHLRMVHAVLLL